jgi:hypothetical protein
MRFNNDRQGPERNIGLKNPRAEVPMNPRPPATSAFSPAAGLAFLCFCAILLATGIFTHAWTRELNPDESQYYAPAIHFVVHFVPAFPLHDYPFPAPPLALWIQALIASVSDHWTVVRFFSTLCAILCAAYFLLLPGRRGGITPLGIVALLTFPFFLWNDFTLKQHAFTLACLLIGLERWCRSEEGQTAKPLAAAAVFLTAAALSNQFCAPLCACLCLDELPRIRTPAPARRARILSAALPLACLALLMLYWGGKQPPAFIDPRQGSVAAGWRNHLAQFMLGALSIGAWLGLISFKRSVHLKPFLIAIIPCAGLVWISRLYQPGGDFWTVGEGPASRLLTVIFKGAPLLICPVAGALAALGAAFFLAPGLAAQWSRRARIFIALYAAITTVAVRYLFESYYLMLIVPLLFLTLRHSEILPANPVRARLYLCGMILLGIAYSVIKLKTVGQ